MADQHNPNRYGEVWSRHRIDGWDPVLEPLKNLVVFSGGWAWHFLSRVGHTEYKHGHDHKDVDLMVPPRNVGAVVYMLNSMGFKKVHTRYDRLSSKEDFRRYEKHYTTTADLPDGIGCKIVRLTIDFFVKDVPELVTPGGWKIVSPEELVTYYSTIHSSKSCWAVVAAKKLLENGADPSELIDNHNLTSCPELDIWWCSKCGWSGQFPKQMGAVTICGGCDRYVARNRGKPTYQPSKGKVVKP